MHLKLSHIFNPDFDLLSVELSTPVTDIFGLELAPKLLEFLIPDEEKLLAADYPDSEIAVERLFYTTKNTLGHWHSEDYPDGFINTEIDAIEFVLKTVGMQDSWPSNNRFFHFRIPAMK